MTIDDRFAEELTRAGWIFEWSGSGKVFRKDRAMIVIAPRQANVVWTVFPTPPQLPAGVVTRPHPIPLATYTLEVGANTIQVFSHVVDRSGSLTKKPFLQGDANAVFAALFRESLAAVDDFVRNVERRSDE